MKKMGNIVAAAFFSILGFVTGGIAVAANRQKKYTQKEEFGKKMFEFYNLLIDWLTLKQEGQALTDYFAKNNYKVVAIYGMKELGERLVAELADSKIEVKYVIDKNINGIDCDYEVLTPDAVLPEVDAIVVTAITFFDEIEKNLSSKVNCPVISLEDVVWESMK